MIAAVAAGEKASGDWCWRCIRSERREACQMVLLGSSSWVIAGKEETCLGVGM